MKGGFDSRIGLDLPARDLAPAAKGILVFPEIFRENYIFGVQAGNGALLIGGRIVGYYTASSIAYGLTRTGS